MKALLARFLQDEAGATAIEYGLIAAGISVVSINYRYSWQAQIAGVKPPVATFVGCFLMGLLCALAARLFSLEKIIMTVPTILICGQVPRSAMGTDAFQDLRLSSFVSAYGQLKHNSVLLAGQPYDEGACAVPGLFLIPDWTGVRAWIEGQPLSMQEGQVLEHRRILDLRRGVLWREWRHRDPNGRITRLITLRLASIDFNLPLSAVYEDVKL